MKLHVWVLKYSCIVFFNFINVCARVGAVMIYYTVGYAIYMSGAGRFVKNRLWWDKGSISITRLIRLQYPALSDPSLMMATIPWLIRFHHWGVSDPGLTKFRFRYRSV